MSSEKCSKKNRRIKTPLVFSNFKAIFRKEKKPHLAALLL